MSTKLGNRYYVEITDQWVAVKDSLGQPTNTVKLWDHKVELPCPCCGWKRPNRPESGVVRQAVELCSRLNQRDLNMWLNEVNDRSTRQMRETPEEKQRNLTEAAITMGAGKVNLIT
jgi:hypothetical protein